MTTYILAALSFVLLFFLWRARKEKDELARQIHEAKNKGFNEAVRYMNGEGVKRIIRWEVRFLNVRNAGDNGTMNDTIKRWQKDGYRYQADKSKCGCMVFERAIYEDEEKGHYID